MSHVPPTPALIPPGSFTRIVNVHDYGALADGVTDDTAAIQAAIDHANSLGGHHNAVVYFPSSPNSYMFSNLKLWAYSILKGERMTQTNLKRITGSTGNAITEYLAADGNTNGARSIWIQNIGIDGNGTVGNGIDLGYGVVGVNFETWATIENVQVQGFTSGTGIHVGANAISMKYIYALSNQDGVHVTGGYSQFHTVYGEQNSRYQLRAAGVGHVFFGVHCEMGASTDPAILIEGGAQSFYGVTIYSGTQARIIEIAAGATKTQLHDVYFFTDGAPAFTHGVYSVDYANARTGSVPYIQHYEMGDSSVASWYVNADDGKINRRLSGTNSIGGDFAVDGTTTLNGTLNAGDADAATHQIRGALSSLRTVGATFAVIDSNKANLRIKDDTALAAGVGGGVLFEGVYTSGGAIAGGGGIKLMKTNATDGNFAFDLVFGARQNGGGVAESFRLKADGMAQFTNSIIIGGASGPTVTAGGGTPEGAVTAPVGSLYMRTDGGAGTSLYVKESGVGNTGWKALVGV